MRRVKCKTCGVRNETLAFLSANTKYTLWFAMQIGGLCRAMTIQDVARRFFDNWKAQLRWQRLGPYETFAAMIERHWDGIAAHCKPENKVVFGFALCLNNKIRVFQRRAYGLKRRRISQAQNPHRRVAGTMKSPQYHPLKNAKSHI